MKRSRRAILTLILGNLAFFLLIVFSDLDGEFREMGELGLFVLILSQSVFSIVLIYLISKYMKEESESRTSVLLLAVLVLGTISFVFLLPGFTVKKVAPLYDSYQEKRAMSEQARIVSLYQEPTYLPPQISSVEKESESIAWYSKHVSITTKYKCIGREGAKDPYIYIELSNKPRTGGYDHYETLSINGKKAVYGGMFQGGPYLILYDGDVQRKLTATVGCKIHEKEEAVKIMESLQPAEYVGTLIYKPRDLYSGYRALD